MHIAALLLSAALRPGRPRPPRPAARSPITTGSAAVTGTVNPGGDATTYQFEYGTSTSYGLTTPASRRGRRAPTDVAARATLSGLTTNTTYHYRVVATNAARRRARAPTRRFKTAAPASAPSISVARGDRRERARGDAERAA